MCSGNIAAKIIVFFEENQYKGNPYFCRDLTTPCLGDEIEKKI